MSWRRRDRSETGPPTVWARAVVVPLEAVNTQDNENNLSADGRAATRLALAVRRDDEAVARPGSAQYVVADVPNWLRIVLHYAGSNGGPSAQLPAEVDVAVQVDPLTGRITAVDLERAAHELAAHREVATRWWKESEAPLADVRGVLSAPRDAIEGVRGLAKAWRRAAGRGEGPAHDDTEREQLRRTANAISHRMAEHPKQLGKIRASALQAGPMMVANVRSGSMTMADLDTWLQFQVGSGAIAEHEAASWRAAAAGS